MLSGYGLLSEVCCLKFAITTTNHKQQTSNCNYTLRCFGGRQPLCGSGVTSLIEITSIPD